MEYFIDHVSCEGCGVCVRFCPAEAIDFPECHCGQWFISDTRCGPMVHARLGIAAENSGKLVSTVRREARQLAEKEDYKIVIVDGPPGIGCPVIASLTGATQVLMLPNPPFRVNTIWKECFLWRAIFRSPRRFASISGTLIRK
jgi:MinD superfamily P-loop ATPase